MANQGNRVKRIYPADMLGIRDASIPNKDARMTNAIVEINGKELEILKRPGYETLTSTSDGVGLGATPIDDPNGNSVILQFSGSSYSTVSAAYGGQWEVLSQINGNNLPSNQMVYNDILYAWFGTSLYTSVNGSSWSLVGTTDGNGPLDLVTSYSGAMFSASGDTATNVAVHSSADGLTWSTLAQSTPATAAPTEGLVSLGGYLYLFLCGANQEVWRSTDGQNWTARTTNAFPARLGSACVALNGNLFVLGGRKVSGSVYTNEVWKSTDGGANWTLVGSGGFSARWTPFYAVANNLVYIGGGRNGSGDLADLWCSQGDTTWQQITMMPTATLTGRGTATPTSVSGNGQSRLVGFQNSLFRIEANSTSATSQYYVMRSRAGQAGGITNNPLIAVTSTTTAAPSGSSFISGSPLDISQNLAHTKIALKNATGAWCITVSGMTIAKVTDADYPATTVRGIVYLDGTFYVMDPKGKIYGSDSEDFTSWTATNFINAQTEPDGGVALIKYNQYVVAFNRYTTEFFFDAGNPTGSPLSPVSNGTLLVGCSCADSVAQLNSSVYFIGQSKVQNQAFGKGNSVFALKGLAIDKISTEDIERILNADGLGGAWGLTMSILGHDCYVINLPTSQLTVFYDTVSQMWGFLTVQTAQTPLTIGTGNMTAAPSYAGATESSLVTVVYASHGYNDGDPIDVTGSDTGDYDGTYNITVVDVNTFTYTIPTLTTSPATGTITTTGYTSGYFPLLMAFEYQGIQVFQNRTDGKLYQFNDVSYADNGAYIDWKIRTARLDETLGGRKSNTPKFMSYADLITDRSAGSMMLRYSDDDYQTYSNYRLVSLAGKRSRINRLGRFYRRVLEMRQTDTIPVRLQALDLALEDGEE